MKRIRLTDKAWAGYTGWLGTIQFVDGASVDQVPRILADKISLSIRVAEIDAEGNETTSGIAERMVAAVVAPQNPTPPLRRFSEEELAAEQKRLEAASVVAKATHIYSRDELEAIAAHKGIDGLREIAKGWGVKDRSIPKLIEKIADAQRAFLDQQIAARAARVAEKKSQGGLVPEIDPDHQALIEKLRALDVTPNSMDPNLNPIHNSQGPSS